MNQKPSYKMCIVEGCYVQRQQGDSYFCENDRKRWRNYCLRYGIENKELKTAEVQVYLKAFLHNQSMEEYYKTGDKKDV